jgi:hypothetical protein
VIVRRFRLSGGRFLLTIMDGAAAGTRGFVVTEVTPKLG